MFLYKPGVGRDGDKHVVIGGVMALMRPCADCYCSILMLRREQRGRGDGAGLNHSPEPRHNGSHVGAQQEGAIYERPPTDS
jgi:hypothetical protein